jgi:acetyl-CoA carboxylase carboxyl transferase subunit alpha
MSEEEIKLDRYAKFRKLGQFREWVVRGGDWRGAQAEREAVSDMCDSTMFMICTGSGAQYSCSTGWCSANARG